MIIHIVKAEVALFRLGLLLMMALALVSCTKPKLDEAALKELVNQQTDALGKLDASAACGLMTEDVQYSLVELKFSGSEKKALQGRQAVCGYLEENYVQMRALRDRGASLNSQMNISSAEIAPDGKSAELQFTGEQTINKAGLPTLNISYSGEATVSLSKGKALYSRMVQRIKG